VGLYLYSDYCQDHVRSFRVCDGIAVDLRDWTDRLDPDRQLLQGVASFGADGSGEALIVSHGSGVVYRLVAGD